MQNTDRAQSQPEPCCLATTIGSLPHTDVTLGTALMLQSTPEFPSWVQFPKRDASESMVPQFAKGMPGLTGAASEACFDTSHSSFVDQLTHFYTRYLEATEDDDAAALSSFGLSSSEAAGFAELCERLQDDKVLKNVLMLKGQVTGPFTLGTTLADQDGRCSYYDEQLRDVIVKTVALKAKWQIGKLGAFGLQVMVFLDEPSLLGYGSQSFLAVSREDIIGDLNEVVAMVHGCGGLAGVHCEANTDWSMLMESDLDILDFDAYDHARSIALYPAQLEAFLERGGWLGWGIVPTLDREAAARETVPSLALRFDDGIEQLARTGLDTDLLLRRALITPSCGAGGVLTRPLAERVLRLLRELSSTSRCRYGFAGNGHSSN